jgi:hypothetical protein
MLPTITRIWQPTSPGPSPEAVHTEPPWVSWCVRRFESSGCGGLRQTLMLGGLAVRERWSAYKAECQQAAD